METLLSTLNEPRGDFCGNAGQDMGQYHLINLNHSNVGDVACHPSHSDGRLSVRVSLLDPSSDPGFVEIVLRPSPSPGCRCTASAAAVAALTLPLPVSELVISGPLAVGASDAKDDEEADEADDDEDARHQIYAEIRAARRGRHGGRSSVDVALVFGIEGNSSRVVRESGVGRITVNHIADV